MSNSSSIPGLAPQGQEQGNTGQGVEDTIRKVGDAAHDVVEQAGDAVQNLTDQIADGAKETIGDLKQEAGKLASEAAETAKSFAEDNKGRVADQIQSFGSALKKAADDLESSDQATFAGYARNLADGVEQLSTTLREKGVEDLFGMVGGYARSQPAAFVGGAAILGFLASRFAVSSATGGTPTSTTEQLASGSGDAEQSSAETLSSGDVTWAEPKSGGF